MNLIVLDFETYYDDEYSLSKMSTEEYVCDPRFHIILVGAKINDAEAVWYSGTHDQIGSWLRGIGLWDSCVVAHKAIFDMLILKVIFGKLPKLMLCTMSMAQPFLRPFSRSVSLDSCIKLLALPGAKGDTVVTMKGRSRQSLSKQELVTYANYCKNDCEMERLVFDSLRPKFPHSELYIIDLTLRMYLSPQFVLDADVLAECLQAAISEKERLMTKVPVYVTPSVLRSNEKFVTLLTSLGIEVPYKISKVTGESTPSLAKTDPGWKELEEQYQDDPEVYPILMARIGVKSSLAETRSKRLLDIANKYGWLRIPLNYYAAHTGRYGGTEKINAQNFPGIRKSRMRYGICAPEGKVVLAADLAQIEARILAALAGQKDLLAGFAGGQDIYSDFASLVFKVPVVKGRSSEDDKRRFVGKTCILGLGYGMSSLALQSTLRKDGLIYTLIECNDMVNMYRYHYTKIPAFWKFLDTALASMSANPAAVMHRDGIVFAKDQIVLPNKMSITYAELRRDYKRPFNPYVYDFGGETRKLWGGTVAENITQALARIVIMDSMLAVHRELGLSPALQQHDEIDYVVPEEDAEGLKARIAEIMVRPPEWMPALPLAVEINYGPTLGDCK